MPRFYLLFLSLVVMSSAFVSCGHHFETPSTAVSTEKLDSLTPRWTDSAAAKFDSVLVYVFDSACPFYTLSDSMLKQQNTLSIGDSVKLYGGNIFDFDGRFYPAMYKGTKGYIKGLGLGRKEEFDFDGDGKMDRILFGFSHFSNDTIKEISVDPITINFLSATGKQYTLKDSGFSSIYFDFYDSLRFHQPTKCMVLHSGYEACSYPQFHALIVVSNGKPEIVQRAKTMSDSGYGSYIEYLMPADSTHRYDTIYIRSTLVDSYSDENDSMVSRTLDSTILYPDGNKWKTVFFDFDTSPKN